MRFYMAAMQNLWTMFRKFPDMMRLSEQHDHFYCYNEPNGSAVAAKNIKAGLKVCDSGAFYYINLYRAKKTDESRITIDLDGFVMKYLDWVTEVWDLFDYFVEFDLQEVIAYSRVHEWRQEISRRGLQRKFIWVYHNTNTLKELDDMLDTCPSRYIGISKLWSDTNYVPYVKRCYDARVLCHGFGMTRSEITKTVPYYSVDSSTWLNGALYNMACTWRHEDARYVNFMTKASNKAERVRERMLRDNISSVHLIRQESSMPMRLVAVSRALNTMLKQKEFCTKLWEHRGIYWDDIEKEVMG